ncbi:MAG: HD domain-containing protein [Deltaproteobacteria bacterium]|nr:HD domain-containing protein [Deltaproteobacteria bacterium]MBW2360627.1 HD domain-containing protein [Deltaproteobacteria bacterium]
MDTAARERLMDAAAFALAAHAGQRRKGSGAPYACHLLQVAGLVLEHGGGSAQAVAGLLHDVVEDCGVAIEELESRFGGDVAGIVAVCTDLLPGDTADAKSPWLERKRGYLAALREAPLEVLLVVGCDKLDNLRSLIGDLEAEGVGVFDRFNGTPEQTLWYYREVCLLLAATPHARVHGELERLSECLAGWVGGRADP